MNCLKQKTADSRRDREDLALIRKAMKKAVDIMFCASALVLAEEFGFGVSNHPRSRMARFQTALSRMIDEAADLYDDALLEGLRNRLENRGFIYEGI